jgi:hypothetical protein
MRCGERLKKHQIPTSKVQRNFKFQHPKIRTVCSILEFGSLEFRWSLNVWSLGFGALPDPSNRRFKPPLSFER